MQTVRILATPQNDSRTQGRIDSLRKDLSHKGLGILSAPNDQSIVEVVVEDDQVGAVMGFALINQLEVIQRTGN